MKVDEAAKTKVFNVKLEARKTAHDGLFLPPDALLQLVCLKGQPLIPCDVRLPDRLEG